MGISRETSVGAALVGAAWLTPVLNWPQTGMAALMVLGCVALSVRRDLLFLRVVSPLASVALFLVTYRQNRGEGFSSAVVETFVRVFGSANERPLGSFSAMVLLGASAAVVQINYRRYWYAAFSAAGIPFGLALSGDVRPYSLALFAVVAVAGTALTPLGDTPRSFGAPAGSRWVFLPAASAVLGASLLALGPGSLMMRSFGGSVKEAVVEQVSQIESALPVPESLSKTLAEDAAQGRITQGQLADMLGENGIEAQLEALSRNGFSLGQEQGSSLGEPVQDVEAPDEQNTTSTTVQSAASTVVDEGLGEGSDVGSEVGSDVGAGPGLPDGQAAPQESGSLNPGSNSESTVSSSTPSNTAVGVANEQDAPGVESVPQSQARWPVLAGLLLLVALCFAWVLVRRRSVRRDGRNADPTPVVSAWVRADESLSLVAGRRKAGVSFIERHNEVRQFAPDLTRAHAELSLMADAELFGGELPAAAVERAEELSFELREGSSKRARRQAARSYERDARRP